MKRASVILFFAFLVALPVAAQEAPADQLSHQAARPDESHGGEGHAAPKTYFGIPGWILKLLNMILFFGLLVYLLRGPIKSAIQSRSEGIRQQLAEAHERREKADRLAEEIRGRLNRLEGEVSTILKRAEEEGERQKQELIAAANDDAEKILRVARSEVEARIKLARKELTDYAGELAAQRAHQILEDSLTEGDRHKLFDESLQSISEKSS